MGVGYRGSDCSPDQLFLGPKSPHPYMGKAAVLNHPVIMRLTVCKSIQSLTLGKAGNPTSPKVWQSEVWALKAITLFVAH